MAKFLDLTNIKFGKLTAIRVVSKDKFGRYKWLCRCDCGKTAICQSGNLKYGNSTSCGCNKSRPAYNRKSLVGKEFSRLAVVEEFTKNRKLFCKCKCSCGNFTTVWSAHLRSNHTTSCGCYQKEQSSKATIKRCKGKFGKDAPRYNPKLTEEERSRYRDNSLKKWAKDILKLNNYTCQKCKNVGGELNAHHLNGYKDYKEKRTLISNGVCLCKKCHMEYHSKFGYLNTNEKDFHCWLGYPEYNITEEDLHLNIPFEVENLGNSIKYISRAGKKDPKKTEEDLKKAIWYIERYIEIYLKTDYDRGEHSN